MAIICTSEPAGPTDVKHPNGFVTSKLPRTSLRLPRVSWLLLLPVEKNDRLRLSTTEHSSKRTIPPLSMPCRKRPFPQRFLMFVPSLAGLNDRFYIKMAQKKARFSHLRPYRPRVPISSTTLPMILPLPALSALSAGRDHMHGDELRACPS